MTKPKSEPHFFDKPDNIRLILRILYSLCSLLVVADFVVHRHITTTIEKLPAFYALYGFAACVLLVLLARLLRTVLMRDEGFYGDVSNPPSKRKGNH